jgi:hypothetical protein
VALRQFNEEKYKSVSVLSDSRIPLSTGSVVHRPHCEEE